MQQFISDSPTLIFEQRNHNEENADSMRSTSAVIHIQMYVPAPPESSKSLPPVVSKLPVFTKKIWWLLLVCLS